MESWILPVVVFVVTYLINMTFISIFYHRSLAHSSIILHPRLRRFVIRYGVWITGIDPKAWVCMHRMHHRYSDTEKDPHSPTRFGYFGVINGQLQSYKRTLAQLSRKRPDYESFVEDLPFEVSWVNRDQLWLLPYLLQLAIGLCLAIVFENGFISIAYFFGMVSHPIYGWLVNSFAHGFGSRNFDLPDHSTNNSLIALFLFGEGLQNNHHRHPNSPNFSFRRGELDPGYWVCQILEKLSLIEIKSFSQEHSKVQ